MSDAFWVLLAALAVFPSTSLAGQAGGVEIDDITGKFHFLSPQDTLALLEEDGKLKGYVDVFQEGEESDSVLSYQVTLGERKKDRVEFKTSKIHQKYYRFMGTVRRGAGRNEGDPDYLQLVGNLKTITVKGETGEETVQEKSVVFKSMSKNERDE